MKDERLLFIQTGLTLASQTKCDKLFLFLNAFDSCQWFLKSGLQDKRIVLVVPQSIDTRSQLFMDYAPDVNIIQCWSGNQTRFSRIKYSFLYGVLTGIIQADGKVICILGPWETNHLDTLTIHDLSRSWSEQFPFDPRSLINKKSFNTVMAMIDIALDIGAMGREGKHVGTIFVIGDPESVGNFSHQAVFNPFRGYPENERRITRPEVVESIKEMAKLDGAIIVSTEGIVEAAGRHLDAAAPLAKQARGLGARHRAAAGITNETDSIAVVVSESTGRVTIFEQGQIIAALEPVISTRLG